MKSTSMAYKKLYLSKILSRVFESNELQVLQNTSNLKNTFSQSHDCEETGQQNSPENLAGKFQQVTCTKTYFESSRTKEK